MNTSNYNRRTGQIIRLCAYEKCGEFFEAHANRRYCCDHCKRKVEQSRRPGRLTEKFGVDPRARNYSTNIAILQKLIHDFKVSYRRISRDSLIRLGFNEDSPTDQIPSFIEFGRSYTSGKRFGNFCLFQRLTSDSTYVVMTFDEALKKFWS